MDLPRFVLLKSNANNKFLCFTKEKNNPSSLRFSYEAKAKTVEAADDEAAKAKAVEAADDEAVKVGFHHLKFEVEKAKSVEGLVHIRSCYNNKYLARKSIDSKSIVAGANEADEDQSKWSCTLFKPAFLDDGESARGGDDDDADLLPLSKAYRISLLHVSESRQRSISKSASDVVGDTATLEVEEDSTDLSFTVFDVEASAILPDYATFMGYNDKYSGKVAMSGLNFYYSDIGGDGVANKIDPAHAAIPQKISIWDNEGANCWSSVSDRITLFSSNKMYFAPIKIGNYVALKCLDVGRFVSSGDLEGLLPDTLVTSATTITDKAMLRVGEPIRMREILDATYDLDDSRIYDVSSVEKFSDSRSNHTDVEQEGSFSVEYDTEQKMTWTNSTTVNIGVKVSWSAGIPGIGKLGIDISYDHEQTWTSGGENTTGKKITYVQNIKIPPGKKVTLKVVAQKAYCDVPYTSKVRDLMTDGTLREYELDGLYSGCNEFEFNTDLIPEDL